jgi:hypothetical protein
LGDLDSAIDLAAEVSHAPRSVRYVRPRRGLRALLMSRVATAMVEEVSIQIEQVLQRRIEYRRPR